MAAPLTPTPVYLQQGNGQVLLSWGQSAGASSYKVYRSTDNLVFSNIASPTVLNYLDTSVTSGTTYYYYLTASNGTESAASTTQSITPVLSGQMTLGQVRLLAQQRADRVNSNFVTMPEWNTYINQSFFELYDILVTAYEDYYVTTPISFATGNNSSLYPLPDGVLSFTNALTGATFVPPPFYKLMGLDLGQGNLNNARFTVRRFNFIDRNQYVFPQLNTNYLGVFNLRYHVLGNNIQFIPQPAGNQLIYLWYIPRMTTLLQDSDILDGVSGWSEYVVVDAAIKALMKEESDTTMLMQQKMALLKRIEESSQNRDAGEPATVSDTRRSSYGNGNGPFGGESFGGY